MIPLEVEELEANRKEALLAFVKAKSNHIEGIKKHWYSDWDNDYGLISYAQNEDSRG